MKAFVIGDFDSNTTSRLLEELCKKLADELDVEITNRDQYGNLSFSIDALEQADVIVPFTYERKPEITFSIGYGMGTGKTLIPYWNGKKERYKKYGFYNEIGDPAFSPEELVEKIKAPVTLKSGIYMFPEGFDGKLRVYIAGDSRTKINQASFFSREKAVNSLGHIGLNPTRVIDLIYSIEDFYGVNNASDMPEEKHVTMAERLKESTNGKVPGLYESFDGLVQELEKLHDPGVLSPDEINYIKNCSYAKRCFRTIDLSNLIWTEIHKPEILGAWIETGYAVAKGLPVIGFNGYDFAANRLSGSIYDEIGKYNEKFGIPKDRWVVETKKDLKAVLDILTSYYSKQ